MFREHVSSFPDDADKLFKSHPMLLTEMLEYTWEEAIAQAPGADPRDPAYTSDLPAIPRGWFRPLVTEGPVPHPGAIDRKLPIFWDHLIYAYMIENTGIYEVFRRVLHEFVHGEKLGAPERDAQHWLRNTEELFYRDPPPFHVVSISSQIRPNLAATRRNAYQRMFGMDLNHGNDNAQSFYPYVPYVRAEAANTGFVPTFEEFLREVWVGIQNIKQSSGAIPKDDARLAELVRALHDMLRARRQHGNLFREEFIFVSMMSWFHLTVEYNSPIVTTLNAEASDPAQRLFKIAEQVGVPAHTHSRSYFALADSISWLLLLIETGSLNSLEAVPALYTPPSPGLDDLSAIMETIINHWSIISPRDIKAGPIRGG